MEHTLGSTLDGYVLKGGHPDPAVFAEYGWSSVGQAYGLSICGFPASNVPSLIATLDRPDPLEVELADGTLLVDRSAADTSTIQTAIWKGASWALSVSGLHSNLNEVISVMGRLSRTETAHGLRVSLERGKSWDQDPSGVVVLRAAGLIEARRKNDKSRAVLPNWIGARTKAGAQVYRRELQSREATSFVLASSGAVSSIVPPANDQVEQSLSVIDGLDLRFERQAA